MDAHVRPSEARPRHSGQRGQQATRGPGQKSWHVRGLLLLFLSLTGFWFYAQLHVWPDTPDGLFHLHRVRALALAWEQGVLYPRWFPDFAFGYGHPIFHYYAPAYYFVAGIFHGLGLDLLTANRLALSALFVLSGLACYALLRRWTGLWPALAGTTLFLFFPYRHYDLFVRGALPEFAAFLWPPLLLYGYDRLLRPSHQQTQQQIQQQTESSPFPPPHWIIFTALAWAGLILTHNLTALMAGIVWLAVSAPLLLRAAFVGGKQGRARRITHWTMSLAAPLFLGGLLSGFYVLPVALEAGWVGIGANPSAPGYATHAVAWAGLWSANAVYAYPTAAVPTVPLPLYVGILSLLGLGAAVTPWGRAWRGPLLLMLLITGGALWLSTRASLPLWDLTATTLGKLQFPWRWQTVISLGAAMLLAFALQILAERVHASAYAHRLTRAVSLTAGLIMLYLIIYGAAGLTITPAPYTAADITPAQMWAFDADHGQIGATWTGEFLPSTVIAPRWTLGRDPDPLPAPPPASESASQSTTPGPIVRPVHLGHQLRVYAVDTPAPLRLSVPHFYFPAWRASVAGVPTPLYPATELAWLTVDLPAGAHVLSVQWQATRAIWLGRLATGAGWLLVGLLLWRSRPPTRRTFARVQMVLWLGAALLAVFAMTNPLATRGTALRSPAPLDLDYAHVHLSAAEIPATARPSAQPAAETVDIVLHWTVRHTPTPLQAFVHLVNTPLPDAAHATGFGAPLAQYDTRIGGDYLPISRHLPGLPLTSHHPLTLPPDLPPGTYAILAGVYFADAPHAPLPVIDSSATDGDDPRREIGRITIPPPENAPDNAPEATP